MDRVNLLTAKDLWAEGRRARTYMLRVALVMIVFAAVWTGNFAMDGTPLDNGEAIGRDVFFRLGLALVFVVGLLTPAYSLPSVSAEMRNGTFETLVCSGMPMWRLVVAKVAACTLVSSAIIPACGPIMALATYYGGVSPSQAATVFAVLASLAFLLAAVSVRFGLTELGRSPIARTFRWFVMYNIGTAVVGLHPLIRVSMCVMESERVYTLISAAVNVALGLWAVTKTISTLSLREMTILEDKLAPQRKDTFGRELFGPDARLNVNPLHARELVSGRHAELYVVGLFIVFFSVPVDLLSLISGQVEACVSCLRVSFGFTLVFCLVCAVYLLSHVISGEREDGTLDLLRLTPLPPSRLAAQKVRSLVTPLGVPLAAVAVRAVLIGVLETAQKGNGIVPVQWFFALCAITALCLLFCAVALCASAMSRTRARATQIAMGVLLAGLVASLVAPELSDPPLTLMSLLAAWPSGAPVWSSLLVAAAAGAAAAGMLVFAVRRLARTRPD